MFDDGFLYLPKTDNARFSFYDFSATESCYSEELLKQRKIIINARVSAGFEGSLEKSDYTWFQEDEAALININQGSYFFGERLKPKDLLEREKFLSKQGNDPILIKSLSTLEKEISNYLVTYNKNLADSHLNHPLNFFYLDLKNILNVIAKSTDSERALEQLSQVTNYIRRVENSFGENELMERSFSAELREAINENIIPQLEKEIEAKNLRGMLVTLANNLHEVVENTENILHHAYTTNEISVHSLLPLSEKAPPQLDLTKHPLHAILDCAKRSADQNLLTPIEPTALFANSEALIKKLDLDHCINVRLIKGISQEEKDTYLTAVSELYLLSQFQQTINDIIQMLDFAGEVSTTLLLTTSLKGYLTELNTKLEDSRVFLQKTIKSNQRIYRSILRSKATSGYTDALLDYLFSSGQEAKQFIENQDRLSTTQQKEEVAKKHYQSIKSSIHNLLSKIDALTLQFESGEIREQAETLITNLHHKIAHLVPGQIPAISASHKPLTLPIPDPTSNLDSSTRSHEQIAKAQSQQEMENNSPAIENSFTLNNCYHGDAEDQTPMTLCQGEEFSTFIFPKSHTPLMIAPPNAYQQDTLPSLGDSYNLSSCRPVEFLSQQGIYCEGQSSNMVYVPTPRQSIDDFVSIVSAQVALGAVFFKIIESGIKWFNTSKAISYASSKRAERFFKDAYKRLSTAFCNSLNNASLREICDDLYHELDALKKDYDQGKKIPLKTLKRMERQINYFRKSTSKLDSSTILKEQLKAKILFSAQTSLSEENFKSIKQLQTSENLNGDLPNIMELRALAKEKGYDLNTLLALSEHWQLIESLTANSAPVYESDVIDLQAQQIELNNMLQKGESIKLHTSPNLTPKFYTEQPRAPLFWQQPQAAQARTLLEPTQPLQLP